MKVYLDYAATGPVKPEVRNAMEPFLMDDFGNPSSIHTWGQVARTAVDTAREEVAKFLNAKPNEIVFTSGGTEADNLAIKGLVLPFLYQNKGKVHIITSVLEHPAVLKTCKALEKTGFELTILQPNAEGIIEVSEVEKAIRPETVLVSIMYVNNEIGTIQPIREIGKMIEKLNGKRKAEDGKRIYFHTDAVQAAEYEEMNVDYLHVDLLTISGHKIGAPKGIGVLYVRKGTPIIPMMHGGEHEFQLRAGTENVPGIVAIGKALEMLRIEDREPRAKKVKDLRDYFINRVIKEIPETKLNGSQEFRSPNNANFYFKYIEGESILLNLDLLGIAASSGSACASHALLPSHVIMAICNNAEQAHGSIRFTLGEKTTREEIDYVIENLKIIIKKLRQISPLTPAALKSS